MNRSVEKGKVLLVKGPASVMLMEGKVTILGASLSKENKIVIRRGKTTPFEAEEDSVLEVILGAEAQAEEASCSTIPDCWKMAAEEAIPYPRLSTFIVLGDVDSGKTSFCTFLANQFIKSNIKPAIIDADLGQSDIGSPTTIGLSLISNPIVDLFTVEPNDIVFVGLTSPSSTVDRLLKGIKSLKEKALQMNADNIIINTDGWIQGEDARNYKCTLITEILPSAVFGIQQSGEVDQILTHAERGGIRTFRCATPPAIKKRDKDERKALREQGYRKFLEGSTLRSLPISWVEFEYTPFSKGTLLNVERKGVFEKIFGCKTLYCEETEKQFFVVLEEGDDIREENVVKAEEVLKKRINIVRDGEEKGLLVGLLDENRQFLSMGMINKVDYENRIIKLVTPHRDKIGVIQFGQIKLDENGKEIGITKAFSI